MNLFKTLSVLLLAIAAVQGAIQCKSGTGGSTYNKACASHATQCVTITTSNSAEGSITGYGCREKRTQKPNGCSTKTSTITGVANEVTKCYCTGNLCNGSGGSTGNASTRSVNFILAFSGVMIALIKVAA